ncbi:MAG: SpoIID/LytB domain-containing protein, partial [Ilumatobacteraceae bacterium]
MRRAVVFLVAALGLTLTPLTPVGSTPSASAASSDIVAVVVEGTGYGHGRGMSQWGAYGWAVDQNKSWEWILDHYYGGTDLTTVNTAQQRIQVRLLALDGIGTLGVTSGSGNVSAGGVSARSLYAKETSTNVFEIWGSSAVACSASTALVVPNGNIAQGSSNSTAVRQIQTFLNAYRISGDAELGVDGQFGPLTAARLRDWQGDQSLTVDGVWKNTDATRARQLIAATTTSAAFTKLTTVAGPVIFTSANSENSAAAPSSVLGVCDASGKVTHYRGSIELHNATSNTNWVVNDVKTEDYLRGVVPKEISASWADAGGGKGINAVMAQAVAARSYGLQQNRYAPYASICDSQSCQVYFGAATRVNATAAATNVEDPRTDAAIVATAGKVRTKNGSIVATEFSASNGPRTAGHTFPAVDDAPGDGTANNPNHKWTRVIDADVLASTYGLGTLTTATMTEAASANNRQYDGIWFNDVLLNGSKRIEAWTFRGTFGLPSPGFTIRVITRDTTTKTFGMIGDSVGNGIAGSFAGEFVTLTDGMFPSAYLTMYDGRCTANTSCPGPTGVEAVSQLPANLDLVVVELGYNDWSPAMSTAIDAMMSALTARGVKQVAWVNLASATKISSNWSTYGQRNAALLEAKSRWANLTILDWDTASNTTEKSRWFASDGVHLTSTGEAAFSLWLRAQIATLAPPGPAPQRLVPPKRIEFDVVGESVQGSLGEQLTIPPDVTAAIVNVTAVGPDSSGYVTVWPCSAARPLTSSLNYASGATVGNGVIAPVDSSGKACFYSSAGTDVVVDLTGWYGGLDGNGSGFVASTPHRLVDTRFGTGAPKAKVSPSTSLTMQVTGTSLKLANGTATTVRFIAIASALAGTDTATPSTVSWVPVTAIS